MNVDLTIKGCAGQAFRLALPDSPRIHVWIVNLDTEVFILSRFPSWYSQFAISAAPIDMLPDSDQHEGATTHRMAFAPTTKRYNFLAGDERPVISRAALASLDFTAADDTMAAHVVRTLAGSLAAGILPAGGRHSRMAWHAAAGAVAFGLHQARAGAEEWLTGPGEE